ncbi:PKD domain-containing protein, partial [Candidatus Micrarchaeota archaeon]|nr:PKD domain-containing protein [Candidatus Micrarchaeota archaeon]
MQKCLVAAGLLLLMASVGLANHDPSIAANDIGVNPAIPTDAQQYSITVTVRNIGQAQANNVNFAVDLDGALVANFACGNIPVAGACTRTTALRGPSVKGPHVATGRLTNCGGGCVGNNNQANLNFNVIRNEGDLTGTITDAGNNPIAGATVTELASGKTAQSDNAGAYTILDIVPGNVQVGVDAPPSYRPLTQAANIVSDQASQLNFMLQDNQQPVVQAAGPIANSKVGRTLSGDASQSTDPDGDALSFEWDWDDGTTDQTPTTSHIYAAPGDYTVTLTVTDSLGLSSAVNFNTHIVLNQLPMAVVNITTPTQIQPPLQQPQQRGQPAGLPISGILKVNQSFTFTGTRSSDPDGMIASYSWDFGDGSTGVGQTVSHFYSQPDDYQVMLTVTDDDGETSTSDIGVRALANLPPSGNITQISACFETQPCTFIAQGSDTDGYVARFLWDFGDATQPSGALPSPSAAATHTYSATGNYTLTLTVIDDNGYPANVTMRVTVFAITDRQPNRAPVVDAGQNMNAVAGQQLTFTGLAVDPEGRPVTMFWSFGDGFVSTANPATHTYAAAGTYVATLTASDGELTGSDSILVTVALRPQNNTTNTTSQQNQTTTTTTTTQQQTTENVPPTAFAGTDRIAVNGQLITLSGT